MAWPRFARYDTVLGTLKMDVSHTEETITCGDKTFKVVNGRDPAAMPWKDMDVEIIIESTGAFNSLDGGSKHLEAGAKKVVLTAPGKNCPTYVVGVNEGDYDAAVKAAADGPMKGIINFEEQPLVSSDFMQTDYSNSVDAALTMVM